MAMFPLSWLTSGSTSGPGNDLGLFGIYDGIESLLDVCSRLVLRIGQSGTER
jgi:hypothetical protein